MKYEWFVCLIMFLSLIQNIGAAESKQAQLIIHHQEKSIEWWQGNKTPIKYNLTEQCNKNLEFHIKEGEEVVIQVADPDLFNYTYDSTLKETENPQIKTMESIVEEIQKFLQFLTPVMTMSEKTITKEQEFQEYLNSILNLNNQLKTIQPNWDNFDGINKIFEDSKYADAKKNVIAYFKKIKQAALAGLAKNQSIQSEEQIILLMESEINALFQFLDQYQDTLALCLKEKIIRSLSYNEKKISQVTVVIGKKADGTDDFTGTLNFTFKPYQPVMWGIRPAVVYSFIKQYSYQTKSTDEGYEIVADSESIKGMDIAAMITLTPAFLHSSQFTGHLEVGLNNLKKESLGFLLGLGFGSSRFSMGLGYAYQKVPHLGKQLQVGDILKSPDELEIEYDFKGGMYIHLTYHVK